MRESMSGGCQCGRIRYTVEIDDFEAYPCHCRMCQRATGGVSIAFKNVEKAKLSWSQEPEYYASSPIARRSFCRECGTPLGFEYTDHVKCDLTVGSFDDPSRFVPVAHFGVESLNEAWIDTSALRRDRADEYDKLIARWQEAGLDVPK
jgi:hypothetical protein